MSNRPKPPLRPIKEGHIPVDKGHTPKTRPTPTSKPGSVQGGHTPTTSTLPGKPPKK